jgi:hypothetical protein
MFTCMSAFGYPKVGQEDERDPVTESRMASTQGVARMKLESIPSGWFGFGILCELYASC